MLAEAHAAAPASLAATAALPPLPGWDFVRDGAPPAKIIRAWRKGADGVHAKAQYNLGCLYGLGVGVAKDAEASAEWFAKAAAQGLAAAQFNLGVSYANGKGVAQDFKAAAAWYAKAAAQGHASAQCNLGSLYATGAGVVQDFKAAALCYAKAAAQGDPDAPAARDAACASYSEGHPTSAAATRTSRRSNCAYSAGRGVGSSLRAYYLPWSWACGFQWNPSGIKFCSRCSRGISTVSGGTTERSNAIAKGTKHDATANAPQQWEQQSRKGKIGNGKGNGGHGC
jgi:TPR repeat protein